MGFVYANIELANGGDIVLAKRHLIGDEEVRRMPLNIMVDTGSIMLAVNEEIRDYLGLDEVEEKRLSRFADGRTMELEVVGPVEIHYEGRICTTNALVLPGDSEPLLGAIPLEEMDLWVSPNRGMLVPAHPDGQIMILK